MHVAGLVLLAWFCLVWMQGAMYFLPAASLQKGNLAATMKTVTLLVFGNPGYSLLVLLFVLVLTPLIVILIPGPGGILIFLHNATTLRLRRFQAGAAGPADWNTLLACERRALDARNWTNMLFPWKE